MLENLTHSTFAELVNTKFRLRVDPENTIDLELIEATDLGSTPEHTQFSLVFLGPADRVFAQQVFPLEHERLGAVELFMTPIGRDATGVRYESIFNRFHE